MMVEYVWLTEERLYARLLHLGAYFSMVSYTKGGLDYEVLVDNSDIEFDNDDDDEY